MASLVLGSVGAALGSFLGGPIGASIGWAIGSAIGSSFEKGTEGPRLENLKMQGSSYGQMLPIPYGSFRFPCQVWWQTDLEEHKNKQGGKGSGPQVVTYSYSASGMFFICEGPILGVLRIWADGETIYDVRGGNPDLPEIPITIYLGGSNQTIDPTMEAELGVGNVPAYNGFAYFVMSDWDLSKFGNRWPSLNAEVFTAEGVYPYRVSLFDPTPDGAEHRNVSYSGGIITVGAYLTASQPQGRYVENQFLPDGTPTGSPIDIMVETGGFPIYAIDGLNAATDGGGIWVKDALVTTILENPIGPNQVETAMAGQTRVYNNGFIFATGGATVTGDIGIARWPATDGVISAETGTADAVAIVGNVSTPDSLSNWVVGCTNVDDACYLYHASTCILYEYAFDLQSVQRQWDLTALNTSQAIVNGYGFTVYRSIRTNPPRLVLGCDRGNSGSKNMGAILLNDDLTATFVGQVDASAGGPIATTSILGGSGYVLVADGVCSLEPPAAPVALSEIVADISDRSGLDASEYDVTGLPDLVDGFAIDRQMTARDAITPLQSAYNFDGVERAGVMTYVKRGGVSAVTIPDDDLATQTGGGDPPPLVTVKRTQEIELAQTVFVNYIDADTDYQPGSQYARRQSTVSQNVVSASFAIVMTAEKARSIAEIVLWQSWTERMGFTIELPRKYWTYEPTDVVTAHAYQMRLINKSDAVAGVVKFEGVASSPVMLLQAPPPAPGEGFTPVTPAPANPSQLLLMNLPLIGDVDYSNGFHAAMAPTLATAWPGARLYKSTDGGINYVEAAGTTDPATIGTVSTALGDYLGGNTVDEINSISVFVNPGQTLESCTNDELLDNANPCVIGQEVLQFRDATLTAPQTYTLTGFLRGRRGTEGAIASHAAGETFALLPVVNVDQPTSELFLSRSYKLVTRGATLASAAAQTFTDVATGARCYAPVNLGGGAVAGGDVTLQWQRRTRVGGEWLPYVDAQLAEGSEAYVVQIWNATYTLCARVITGVAAQSTVYTSADQVTDFGAQQAHVYFTVGQIGAYGLGTQARGVAIGLGGSDAAPIAPVQPYQSGPSSPPAGGNTVDQVLTGITAVETAGFVIGNSYVVEFTTRASPAITDGNWLAAEYQEPPCFRHAILSTDVNGATVLGENWGMSVNFFWGAGAGQIALANSTTYYIIIRSEYTDGSLSGPAGLGCKMRMSITGVF